MKSTIFITLFILPVYSFYPTNNNNKTHLRKLIDNCPSGKYFSNGRRRRRRNDDKCISCPKGKHKLGDNRIDICNICPSGQFANSIGLSSCIGDICPTGKYGYTGQTNPNSCFNCSKGQFQNKQGQNQCILCPSGLFNNKTTQSYCINTSSNICKPGYFGIRGSTSINTTYCYKCPKGQFNNAYGLSNCFYCPEGKYQPFTAKNICYDIQDNCSSTHFPQYTQKFGLSTQENTICKSCFKRYLPLFVYWLAYLSIEAIFIISICFGNITHLFKLHIFGYIPYLSSISGEPQPKNCVLSFISFIYSKPIVITITSIFCYYMYYCSYIHTIIITNGLFSIGIIFNTIWTFKYNKNNPEIDDSIVSTSTNQHTTL